MTATLMPNSPSRVDADVLDQLRRARDRSVVLGRPVVAAFWSAVPDPIDPLAVFEAGAGHDHDRVLWQQRSRQTWFVGLGSARAIETEGRGRFQSASKAIRSVLRDIVADHDALDALRFVGGFAFDAETTRSATWRQFPDGLLILPRWLVVHDHRGTGCVCCVEVSSETEIEATAAALRTEAERLFAKRAFQSDQESPKAQTGPVCLEELPSADLWKAAVQSAIDATSSGALRKVVLARSTTFTGREPFSVAPALAALGDASASATVFAIARGDSVFIGATPELLVRLEGNRFETVALAGTVGRGDTPEADLQLASRLLASAKDRDEHEIVVETILSALRPVSRDVRRAEGTPRVERAKSVQHLSTPISGTLTEDATVLSLVERLHPTPAVGGAPRGDALAFIRAHEDLDRGWYAGPVGWIGANGNGEFAVALRSGIVNGDTATIFAGCGVVADSTPDGEYAETAVKFRPMLEALGVTP